MTLDAPLSLVDQLRASAEAGLTKSEAAAAAGVSIQLAHYHAKCAGLVFVLGKRRPCAKTRERYAACCAAGLTKTATAHLLGRHKSSVSRAACRYDLPFPGATTLCGKEDGRSRTGDRGGRRRPVDDRSRAGARA